MAKKASDGVADAVDWKKLKQADGSAERMPESIRALATGDASARAKALASLEKALWTSEQWFSAGPPATDLLLDVAAGGGEPAALALALVVDILTANHLRSIGTGFDPKVISSRDAKAVHARVVARVETVLGALGAKEPTVRAAAALLLAFLDDASDRSLAALRRSVDAEADAGAKASMLLALAHVGRSQAHDQDLARIESGRAAGQPVLIRGAAALARLIVDARATVKSMRDELVPWVCLDVERTVFPWGRGGTDRVYLPVTRRRDEAERADAADIAAASVEVAPEAPLPPVEERHTAPPTAVERAAYALIVLAGFTERFPEKEIALPEDLTPTQRRAAEALASRDGIRRLGWGLPPSGRDRRRWLGLVPAGPLEKRIRFSSDGAEHEWPVWKVWRASFARDKTVPIPSAVREALSATELLAAVAEVSGLMAYEIRHAKITSPPEVSEMVNAAGASAIPWARSFAEEAVPLFARAPVPETGMVASPLSNLQLAVILPMFRAGQPLESWLDPLVPHGPADFARPVLESLDPARREAIAYARLARVANPASDIGVETLMPIVDLVPSERIIAILTAKLQNPAVRARLRVEVADAHLARLAQLQQRG
jgi:hypothetical protein